MTTLCAIRKFIGQLTQRKECGFGIRFGSRSAHSMLILLPLFQLKIYRHSQIIWSSVRAAGLWVQWGCIWASGQVKTYVHYLQKQESLQKRILSREGKQFWDLSDSSLCCKLNRLSDFFVVFFHFIKCTRKKTQPWQSSYSNIQASEQNYLWAWNEQTSFH